MQTLTPWRVIPAVAVAVTVVTLLSSSGGAASAYPAPTTPVSRMAPGSSYPAPAVKAQATPTRTPTTRARPTPVGTPDRNGLVADPRTGGYYDTRSARWWLPGQGWSR